MFLVLLASYQQLKSQNHIHLKNDVTEMERLPFKRLV